MHICIKNMKISLFSEFVCFYEILKLIQSRRSCNSIKHNGKN